MYTCKRKVVELVEYKKKKKRALFCTLSFYLFDEFFFLFFVAEHYQFFLLIFTKFKRNICENAMSLILRVSLLCFLKIQRARRYGDRDDDKKKSRKFLMSFFFIVRCARYNICCASVRIRGWLA